MQSVTYSAPAKVILSGEHAVVYGRPALVSAIDLRLQCTVSQGLFQEQNRTPQDAHINRALEIIRNYAQKHLEGARPIDETLQISIDSHIPRGKGLGSSAALSAALSASCLHLILGKTPEKEEINACAYEVEKYFHTRPSGVDNTTCVFGGLIYYRKEFEFLKNISYLGIHIPRVIQERLFLIDSGAPTESTKQMVEQVGDLYNKRPVFCDGIFARIERATKRMVVAIAKEDASLFGSALEENGKLLTSLGVVSKSSRNIMHLCTTVGAVAKITGAGGKKTGSGNILAYTPDPKLFLTFCAENHLSVTRFSASREGVALVKE